MRFDARHVGSGVWGVWDGGTMGWRGTDLAENEAKQRAADMNIMFDQYGDRHPAERREVQPPMAVESATWSAAGELDYWVKRTLRMVGPGARSRRSTSVDQGRRPPPGERE